MYGRHLLIDFYECNAGFLSDPHKIEEVLLDSAKVAHATILEHCFHRFAPQGVSGVVVIAESHISIHTWPEEGYAAIDLFTCSNTMKPEAAVALLKAVFEPGDSEIRDLRRGENRGLRLAIKSLAESTQSPANSSDAVCGIDEITIPNFRL